MYNAQLRYVAEQQKAGNAFVLCPERTLPVGRVSHNRSNMRAAYTLGRKLATAKLPHIQEFLTQV